MFWTDTQKCFWDDFYNEPTRMRRGFFVPPKYLNEDHYAHYLSTDFEHVDVALKKMDVFGLATIKVKLMPDLIRHFFCTSYFHTDDAHTVTWMTGAKPYSASFDGFCNAMGYPPDRVSGFCIHSEKAFSDNQLLSC